MSVELHVLFGGKVPTKAALTRAMKELGFPVTIPTGGKPLAQQSGYLPMKLRREESGVEVDAYDDRSVVEEIAGKDFDPRYQRCVSFRWGGDEREMLCGLCTAAALAKLVDGIVRDDDGRHVSADQAIAEARESLKLVKPTEPRYGTRPADIKRYLKPLLELRSDLVVVGRHVFIRPVRHLLRGAQFWRTSNKYRFEITADVQPLYGPDLTYGYDVSRAGVSTEVWQPHFAAQLFDALKTDIFDRWGPVTTLDGFATELINHGGAYYSAPIVGFALAGEGDRAAEWAERAARELTDEIEKARIRELWEQLTTDIGAVCAKLHAQEAENVNALKLERIWEPSPFPVELPAAERARSAEPLFLTTPWIPTPPGLWQELPKEPGEVRFAKDRVRRDDDLILPVALARAEAEERHRHGEDYVLTVRLPDGLLLLIAYFWHWDRHMPDNRPFGWRRRTPTYVIELHGTSRWVLIGASSRLYDENTIELNSIDVLVKPAVPPYSRWYCYVHLQDGHKSVHDRRSGEKVFTQSELTDEERALATCAVLAFGEYAAVETRARALLRALGYDETIS